MIREVRWNAKPYQRLDHNRNRRLVDIRRVYRIAHLPQESGLHKSSGGIESSIVKESRGHTLFVNDGSNGSNIWPMNNGGMQLISNVNNFVYPSPT